MNERYPRKAAFTAAFLIFSAVIATAAHASLAISPVRVELSNDHDKDVIRVANQETAAKSYEVEVVAWSQTDEKREVYEPTEDIVAVPPLFTLNPGEEQLIRIGMLSEADPGVEKSYRMFITELAPSENSASRSATINMRLQIGIPVFVAPDAIPSATLTYVETKQIGDQSFVRFRNTGNVHVKVTEVQYDAPGLEETLVTPASVYFLAGKSGYLPIQLPDGEPEGKVTIVTDNLGSMEYELPFAL